jgi:glycosyltransferase involved in cell wall biosynthesis
VEYVVEEMAEGMAKMGCEVSVLTLSSYPSLLGTERKNGVTIKRIFGMAPFQAYYFPSPSLLKELLTTPCDIIHVHAVHSLTAPASVIAAFLRTKLGRTRRFVVLTPHYHDIGFSWHTRFAWLFYRPIVRLIMRNVDLVHAISYFESGLIKGRSMINPIILGHGISEDVLQYEWGSPKTLTVTYAGRLERYKRVDMLIQAMERVNEQASESKLLVIGNGPDRSRLMKLAEECKVNVIFIDYLPRNEYLKRLACSSMVVNLSSSEAFGVTILEALAMGVPVIVVKPWGTTFERYSMSKVLPNNPTVDNVARAILSTASIRRQARPHVPTWNEVCSHLYEDVYGPLTIYDENVGLIKNRFTRKR